MATVVSMRAADEEKTEDALLLEELVEGSTFETTFFNKEENNSYGHCGSVIKEIQNGEDGSYLVKIRPPMFYLMGVLSNISRILSGTKSRKILDNRRWQAKEIEHLRMLHPDVSTENTPFENAILMQKIDGRVVHDILRSPDISNDKKREVVVKTVQGLENIHSKNLYHGEPNTQNCIFTEDEEIYWIDFEVEYHPSLTLPEKKAKDLEQLTLSIMGAFEQENEIGMSDEALIDLILETYTDREVRHLFLDDPNLPLIGPIRFYQLSFSSVYRFYQTQMNLLRYIDAREHTP